MNANVPHWQYFQVQQHHGYKTQKIRGNVSNGREADAYINNRGRVAKMKEVCLDDGLEDYDYPRDFGFNPGKRSEEPMTISLADVKIRVAKPKGIRKEYDWVDSVRPVIAIDDDLKSVFSEDDWEELYAEQQAYDRKSYSAVTSGGG
ncbi:hypothetical protein DFP72DRAFT_808274 [Ephemerocybe angulata]|uniref:Uncharacterized protein n=1 Tax=Ephemerocybe angulata TaxID=980116 RepID=A0A8H6I5Q6_9AGAR|nr:hypothetical protein DFP72DRAFT_808274 [Tulosesus angulatus]